MRLAIKYMLCFVTLFCIRETFQKINQKNHLGTKNVSKICSKPNSSLKQQYVRNFLGANINHEQLKLITYSKGTSSIVEEGGERGVNSRHGVALADSAPLKKQLTNERRVG